MGGGKKNERILLDIGVIKKREREANEERFL